MRHTRELERKKASLQAEHQAQDLVNGYLKSAPAPNATPRAATPSKTATARYEISYPKDAQLRESR